MSRIFRYLSIGLLGFLLVSCKLLQTDITPGLNQRVQEICDTALKDGKLQNCEPLPYNIQSSRLTLSPAAQQKGIVAAWCAQYDYSQMDKATQLWATAHDTVLLTQAQDQSFSSTPIDNLPATGCSGYTMP